MNRKKIRSRIIILVLLIQPLLAFSQERFLSKEITLNIPECSLDQALREIGKAGQFSFSYNADLVPSEKPVSIEADNVRVGEILKKILGKEIRYREIGNHVILLRNRSDSREKLNYPDIEVTGTVTDASDHKPLKDATVYVIEDKISVLSDENGGYKLIIPTGKKTRSITCLKRGYADTVIFINQAGSYRINIPLRPLYGSFSKLDPLYGSIRINGIDSLGFISWMTPREAIVNAQNLEMGSTRAFQVSLVPHLSSNRRMNVSSSNAISLNFLAGYNGGLRGFELGGLLNVTRNVMRGMQVSAGGNMVGFRGAGVQIAGLFNYNLGKFEGVQMAALFNYVRDTVSGTQLSIITNVAHGYNNSWQVSGLLNVSRKKVNKVQLSGIMNYGADVKGTQITGVLNIARHSNDGVQIAAILNYATTLNGVQVGLVNVSNTVERGIPVGIFSYVQQGYHLFEVSGNEIFYGNVAFKSGTKSFYNFVQFGMGKDYKLLGAYGIGTILTVKNQWSLNIDASAGFVYHPIDTIYHGLLLKFNPAFEYRFAKHLAIFLGPAYNFFLFPKDQPSATPRGLSPYDFYFRSTPNASIQMWIGGVLGLRI